MQPESQKADRASCDSLLGRVFCELSFVLIALGAVLLASHYLGPVYVDSSLVNSSSQFGWPFAYIAKYINDLSSYTYDIGLLTINLLLFYIPIRFVAQRYNSRRYAETCKSYAECIILCMAGLVLIYCAISTLASQPAREAILINETPNPTSPGGGY